MRGAKLAWLRATVAELVANPTNECVPHPFKKGAGPETSHYGDVVLDGRKMGMHRAALIIVGRTPAGRGGHTRHLCGNDRCVNPSHIVAGTGKENAADRERHGRTARGAKIPQFKLSDDAVREIRSSPESNKVIAERFDIHPTTVGQIRNGKRRQHVK